MGLLTSNGDSDEQNVPNAYRRVVEARPDIFEGVIGSIADRLNADYVGVHILEGDKQLILASTGVGGSTWDKRESICRYTVQEDKPLYIPDLTTDPRTRELHYVARSPGMRSYIGVPLCNPDGLTIGTISAMDQTVFTFENDHLKILQAAAQQVVEILEIYRSFDAYEEKFQQQKTQLKEIHHRLKNNLNVITGLIELERLQISHPAFAEILEGLQKRIQSVATLHRRLYEGEYLEHVQVKPYLKELLGEMCNGMTRDELTINYNVSGDPLVLSQDRAVYLGLLVNELMTNSLKHGFKKKSEGIVEVKVVVDSNTCILEYQDDGTGLPADFSFDSADSLGMRLVGKFVEQLGGNIQAVEEEGAHFRVIFPLEQE